MTAYYNEHDPKAAAWLRELIKRGHIAPGVVDERSIEDIRPDELREFTQCHFFAGIGGWSLALRRAGWPDDRPVWTGSCPCQSFSAAGEGAGFNDERHLWPAWFHLISQRQPIRIYGEQVASPLALAWLDLVQTDLEAADYAVGAVDLCAAGVGSPNIRQRLWFVAERLGVSLGPGLERHPRDGHGSGQPGRLETEQVRPATETGGDGGLAVSDATRQPAGSGQSGASETGDDSGRGGEVSRLALSDLDKYIRKIGRSDGEPEAETSRHGTDEPVSGELIRAGETLHSGPAGPTNGRWRDVDWLLCRDGKWRPVEPGTFPLANGVPSRVGLLRGYGNAINVEVATEVIRATL